MTPRVQVRGVGAWTSFGTWRETFPALAEGRCGIATIQGWDPSGFPCVVASECALPPGGEPEGERREALALPAAEEAWEGAGRPEVAPERLGVFVGAEGGRLSLGALRSLAQGAGARGFDHEGFAARARARSSDLAPGRLSPSSVASALAGRYGAEGPVETVSLACASSAAAVLEAVRALRAGECDVALAGGVGADVDAVMLASFGLLGALSERGVSRPFDVHRDGFVLGEGAAFVVLTTRDEEGLCELAGVGSTLDAHHLTAPDPEGDGAARALTLALGDAGESRVDHVQAHGTSTPLNDASEALALTRALGPAAGGALVSSVKGALGHLLAGAGALGLLCAVEAVRRGVVLPTAGLRAPDPALPELAHVRGEAVAREVRVAVANAFAFGGANVSLVVRAA